MMRRRLCKKPGVNHKHTDTDTSRMPRLVNGLTDDFERDAPGLYARPYSMLNPTWNSMKSKSFLIICFL